MISWKTREVENLQKALDEELNTPKKPRGRGAIGVCSPTDKINECVRLTFSSLNISNIMMISFKGAFDNLNVK